MGTIPSFSRLFIVRHGEAIKNLEKIHGGGTQALTEIGEQQSINAGAIILDLLSKRELTIFHQKEDRSKFTAEIIKNVIGTKTICPTEISGIGLGDISQLSEPEVEILYPEVAKALLNWKNGKAGIQNYPEIPGREHTSDFAIRINNELRSLIRPGEDMVLVGTTSTINMINHLLTHNWTFDKPSYEFISFPYAGINCWQIEDGKQPKKVFSNF